MSIFMKLTGEPDKAIALQRETNLYRNGQLGFAIFDVGQYLFDAVSGSPFCYDVPPKLLSLFKALKRFDEQAAPCCGMSTLDDFRFVRCWWEHSRTGYPTRDWVPYSKGEENVPFYDSLGTAVLWRGNGLEVKSYVEQKVGSASRKIQSESKYFREGITWVRRTHRLCLRPLPRGSIFTGGAQAIFVDNDILPFLGLGASAIFDKLTKISVGRTGDAVQFEVGMLAKVPTPPLDVKGDPRVQKLGDLVRRAWSLQRTRDSENENSLAFLLPAALRAHVGDYDPPAREQELGRIQSEIDAIAFDLYGFSEDEREPVLNASMPAISGASEEGAEDESAEGLDVEDNTNENDSSITMTRMNALLSWAVGVAFGRFDWRLATGEREAPAEPEPFDPLPARSPGMLPDGAAPFHTHAGILVDDAGHPHDLARLVEEVLALVDVPVPEDVRRWLQRDFFPFHLQRYSKSRRKVPIYWPLATVSGSYTLWVYYPSLTSQTLYTAINDFLEPKLKEVVKQSTTLRAKGNRTREEAKALETLADLEQELIELRDELLRIAPTYRPNHDDGVQITAAPLWPLFRHKPWQKLLKDTWDKLEKGDYDWSHLAIAYWPDRVRKKCETDKSLAIAHGLEDLYKSPAEKKGEVKKKRKRQ